MLYSENDGKCFFVQQVPMSMKQMQWACLTHSWLCVSELLLHWIEKHRKVEQVLLLDHSEPRVNRTLETPLLSGKLLAVKSSNTRVCSCVAAGRVEQVCSTLLGLSVKWNSLVCMSQIEFWETFSSGQGSEKILYPWQWIGVHLSHLVDCQLIITADPDWAIALHHRDYRGCPVRELHMCDNVILF